MPKCNARKKNGDPCTHDACHGYDKCRMHLGFNPNDLSIQTDKANKSFVKNKYLMDQTNKEIKDKLQTFKDMPDLLDLTDELVLSKALLSQALETDNLSMANITNITNLINKLGNLTEIYISTRNATSLTTAEVSLIYAGMAQLVREFVPLDKQAEFIAKLRELSGQ